jgi:hypothetical protein
MAYLQSALSSALRKKPGIAKAPFPDKLRAAILCKNCSAAASILHIPHASNATDGLTDKSLA